MLYESNRKIDNVAPLGSMTKIKSHKCSHSEPFCYSQRAFAKEDMQYTLFSLTSGATTFGTINKTRQRNISRCSVLMLSFSNKSFMLNIITLLSCLYNYLIIAIIVKQVSWFKSSLLLRI